MRKHLRFSLKYALTVIGAAYVGLLVQLLVTVPLRMMFESRAEYILSSICCVLGSMVALFCATVKYGYDENTPEKPLLSTPTVIQTSAAVVLYILLTVIFRYYTGAATNVCYMAQVMGDIPTTVGIKRMAAEHGGLMFLSLVLQATPFIPAMLAGYAFGGVRRRKSREKILGETKR